MATVRLNATGKKLLSDVSVGGRGVLLVHIPASATIEMNFVGRPRESSLVADDDVALSYYTPASDTLAATNISNAGTVPVQVHVKADGNLVYANVVSITGTVDVAIAPLSG